MSESEDKAKKLKEIQERLAEIQGGAAKSADKPTPPPSSKPAPATSTTPKATEPKVSSASSPQQKTSKTTATKKEVAEKKVTTTKTKSQEEINWKENRRKDNKSLKAKKSSSSKLSKVYTIISLIITLAVCSYFVYTFFLSSDDETELISKVPEDLVIEEHTEEPMAENTEQANESEEKVESAEVVQQEVVSDNRKIETSKSKATEVKAQPKATPVSSAITSKVPNGIIISYASNSTKEMAEKNAKLLSSKGFKASYYYMPDKNPSSPQLYKVYVGPYDSESAAMPDFKKIVKLNDKAFILRAN